MVTRSETASTFLKRLEAFPKLGASVPFSLVLELPV